MTNLSKQTNKKKPKKKQKPHMSLRTNPSTVGHTDAKRCLRPGYTVTTFLVAVVKYPTRRRR